MLLRRVIEAGQQVRRDFTEDNGIEIADITRGGVVWEGASEPPSKASLHALGFHAVNDPVESPLLQPIPQVRSST